MGAEARMKSLLSVSLILLSSSSTSTSKLFSERNDDCTTSSPFLIKNDSPNTKQPYLTLNVKKNSLSGGKLSKGKPKKNQIWTWVNCGDGDFLSSEVEGKLLAINGKALSVVDGVSNSPVTWIFDSELGTLQDTQSKKYVRLIKKKARVALTKKLRLMKKGPEKGKPWGWFRWTLEFWDSESGSGSGFGSGSGSGSASGCVDYQTTNGTSCQFPFYYNGVGYNNCVPGENPWCATKVDGVGNLLQFQGSSAWGYCEANCPTDTDSTVSCPHS